MKIIIIVVILAIVGVAAFAVVENSISGAYDGSQTALISSDVGISLTISGEINRPGTYILAQGSKLIDLIDAASGTTSNADTLSFNTDYVLTSKGSYYIAPIYDNANTCAVTPISKVNVNKASAEDLHDVAGFTKAAANAVVSYRLSATFNAIEEIKNVSGIGDATYMAVRDKITLRDAEV